MTKKLLTLNEVCALTGCSKDFVYHNWVIWKEKCGVRVYKVNNDQRKRPALRFEYEDILKMIESWQVV